MSFLLLIGKFSIPAMLSVQFRKVANTFLQTTKLQQITLNMIQIRVENIIANGEIAHFEQFLPLHQCFKSCLL